MLNRKTFAKLIGWPLVAIIPFCYGIDSAYAKVGIASAVNGQPRSKQPNETERVIHIGNEMVVDETIKTNNQDRVHVVFLDGSTLTVGPNSIITIDKFVYDTTKKTGTISLDAGKGAFRYVGGAISKTSDVTVKTPSATMGIRGGISTFTVDSNGYTVANFLFGKMLMVTAQGVTKATSTPGTQITAEADSIPSDPRPIPPVYLQEINKQFQSEPVNNPDDSISQAINGSDIKERNSNLSPRDVVNSIANTQEAQNNVHNTEPEVRYATGPLQGAGPLESTGPLQGREPVTNSELQQSGSPLQNMGALENNGPLETSSPMQAAGPLQSAGPLNAASPLQQTGPINGQINMEFTGTFPGMAMPYIPTQNVNFVPFVSGIASGDATSLQQLQQVLNTPQGTTPSTLSSIVNAVTYVSPTTPTFIPTVLPPTVYNPSSSANVSPN